MNDFSKVYFSLLAIYLILIIQRLRYFYSFRPKILTNKLSKNFQKQLTKAYKNLNQPTPQILKFTTNIVPISKSQTLVYDTIQGTATSPNTLLILPQIGSVHSLTEYITPLIPYFSTIYILNPRIVSPYYRDTTPLHSHSTFDIEFVLNNTKTTKILIIGDSPAAIRISSLRTVKIAQISLDFSRRRMERFQQSKARHLLLNKQLNLPVSALEMVQRCDNFVFQEVIDKVREEGKLRQQIDRKGVFEVMKWVGGCQGGMEGVAAAEWLVWEGK